MARGGTDLVTLVTGHIAYAQAGGSRISEETTPSRHGDETSAILKVLNGDGSRRCTLQPVTCTEHLQLAVDAGAEGLHYVGHANLRTRSGRPTLDIAQSGTNGLKLDADRPSATDIEGIIMTPRRGLPPLGFVVLSACTTLDMLLGLRRRGLPFGVCWLTQVENRGAAAFAKGFYSQIKLSLATATTDWQRRPPRSAASSSSSSSSGNREADGSRSAGPAAESSRGPSAASVVSRLSRQPSPTTSVRSAFAPAAEADDAASTAGPVPGPSAAREAEWGGEAAGAPARRSPAPLLSVDSLVFAFRRGLAQVLADGFCFGDADAARHPDGNPALTELFLRTFAPDLLLQQREAASRRSAELLRASAHGRSALREAERTNPLVGIPWALFDAGRLTGAGVPARSDAAALRAGGLHGPFHILHEAAEAFGTATEAALSVPPTCASKPFDSPAEALRWSRAVLALAAAAPGSPALAGRYTTSWALEDCRRRAARAAAAGQGLRARPAPHAEAFGDPGAVAAPGVAPPSPGGLRARSGGPLPSHGGAAGADPDPLGRAAGPAPKAWHPGREPVGRRDRASKARRGRPQLPGAHRLPASDLVAAAGSALPGAAAPPAHSWAAGASDTEDGASVSSSAGRPDPKRGAFGPPAAVDGPGAADSGARGAFALFGAEFYQGGKAAGGTSTPPPGSRRLPPNEHRGAPAAAPVLPPSTLAASPRPKRAEWRRRSASAAAARPGGSPGAADGSAAPWCPAAPPGPAAEPSELCAVTQRDAAILSSALSARPPAAGAPLGPRPLTGLDVLGRYAPPGGHGELAASVLSASLALASWTAASGFVGDGMAADVAAAAARAMTARAAGRPLQAPGPSRGSHAKTSSGRRPPRLPVAPAAPGPARAAPPDSARPPAWAPGGTRPVEPVTPPTPPPAPGSPLAGAGASPSGVAAPWPSRAAAQLSGGRGLLAFGGANPFLHSVVLDGGGADLPLAGKPAGPPAAKSRSALLAKHSAAAEPAASPASAAASASRAHCAPASPLPELHRCVVGAFDRRLLGGWGRPAPLAGGEATHAKTAAAAAAAATDPLAALSRRGAAVAALPVSLPAPAEVWTGPGAAGGALGEEDWAGAGRRHAWTRPRAVGVVVGGASGPGAADVGSRVDVVLAWREPGSGLSAAALPLPSLDVSLRGAVALCRQPWAGDGGALPESPVALWSLAASSRRLGRRGAGAAGAGAAGVRGFDPMSVLSAALRERSADAMGREATAGLRATCPVSVIGGDLNGGGSGKPVYELRPDTGRWVKVSPLLRGRRDAQGVWVADKGVSIVTGGFDPATRQPLRGGEQLDPRSSDGWRPLPHDAFVARYSCAFAYDDVGMRLYRFGGLGEGVSARSHDFLDLRTMTWSGRDDRKLRKPVVAGAAVIDSARGVAYISGGTHRLGTHRSLQVMSLATGDALAQRLPAMDAPRSEHGMLLL